MALIELFNIASDKCLTSNNLYMKIMIIFIFLMTYFIFYVIYNKKSSIEEVNIKQKIAENVLEKYKEDNEAFFFGEEN